jgi:nicotinate-nucleotide pyrophosphorylase
MSSQIDFTCILPTDHVDKMIKEWLHEDMPSFDVGGLVVGSEIQRAQLWMKSSGVFAGKPFFTKVFEVLGCGVEWQNDFEEGQYIDVSSSSDGAKRVCLATVTGPVHQLLRGERTALNILSRCSGVATVSRKAVMAACQEGWGGYVAGTRKTTPGSFRIVEKYGLLVGGAATHRLDLSQMVMLKDNHIWSAGGIAKAVRLARAAAGFSQKIEVECQSLEEAMEAASAGADVSNGKRIENCEKRSQI